MELWLAIMRKEDIKLMKAIRILGRSIRDSFKSIIRNFSLSIAAILCVTITLLLVSVSIIASANINYTTENIENELSIVVYLDNAVTEERIVELEGEFNNIEKVSEVVFKSKDEWKTEMSEYDETFETVLNYLDENPLLDTFTIKVKSVEDLSDVAEYIKTTNNVNTVKYGEGMVDSIISAFSLIQKVTIGLVIALVLVTAFLISNTIKLAIFSRRNEIEIMRLVGASNLTIKLPFFFEGLIIGFLGSIIPISITIYGYIIIYSSSNGVLFSNMVTLLDPYYFVFYVSGILILIGCVVGVFGSLRAVRKYLKV